jgi:hypothetical protein
MKYVEAGAHAASTHWGRPPIVIFCDKPLPETTESKPDFSKFRYTARGIRNSDLRGNPESGSTCQ